MGVQSITGLVMGQPVRIWRPERRSVADPVGNDTLYWGDQALVLDLDNMQPRIVRLVPPAYATACRADQWEPFIRACLTFGLLR